MLDPCANAFQDGYSQYLEQTVFFNAQQAFPRHKSLILRFLAISALISLGVVACHSSPPSKNTVSIPATRSLNGSSLSLAVISDLHLSETDEAYDLASRIFSQILKEGPDLVLVLGDLISSPSGLNAPVEHRRAILDALEGLPKERTAIVLGNYESWDDRGGWLSDLETRGFNVLENEVRVFRANESSVCVRGLGDMYTDHYEYTPLPRACAQLPTITITHDPAAAFEEGVEGVVIAGHTHCGQVSLPLIGPLWAPTKAPREAWCGLYQDELRTLWVSSGVGTSILPVRLGTRSEWDLIEIFP